MDTTTSSNYDTSPATTPGSSMSVQAYTSQFIKEGLRIKMRQKMGSGGNENSTQGNTVAWRGSPIIFHFVDLLTPTDTLGCMLIPLGVSSILKDFKESKLSWKVWDSNPCSILSKVFIVKT